MGVPGPRSIFLKLGYTIAFCEGDSMGGVALTGIIYSKTVGRSIMKPSVPLQMGGSCYLFTIRFREEGPWWIYRINIWRGKLPLPKEVRNRKVKFWRGRRGRNWCMISICSSGSGCNGRCSCRSRSRCGAVGVYP